MPNHEQIDGVRRHFCTWRHTGASTLAESGADPVMIVKMIGDSSLTTVMAHYIDNSIDYMQKMVAKWQVVSTGRFFERRNQRKSAKDRQPPGTLVAHTGFEPVLPP